MALKGENTSTLPGLLILILGNIEGQIQQKPSYNSRGNRSLWVWLLRQEPGDRGGEQSPVIRRGIKNWGLRIK